MTGCDPGQALFARFLDAEDALIAQHKELWRRVEAEGHADPRKALDRRMEALTEILAEATALRRRTAEEARALGVLDTPPSPGAVL